MKRHLLACFLIALTTGIVCPLHAGTIQFTLLGDPNQNYTFNRTDSPQGGTVSDPVGPYPGYLGPQTPSDLFGFLCIDYLKTANWNTTYSGSVYSVADAVPGKTQAQLVEAAYLITELMWLGGSAASTELYQGPISFAVWQIMDPAAGHVPVSAAAQPYVLEAQQAFLSGSISASDFPNVQVFIPDNGSIQDFMTATAPNFFTPQTGVPEPASVGLITCGLALFLFRRFGQRGAAR